MIAHAAPPALGDFVPTVLPPGWRVEGITLGSGTLSVPAVRFVVVPPKLSWRPLVVLLTLDHQDDGHGWWLHSSTSRTNTLPSWDDLKLVHRVVHQHRPVVQILPPPSSWLSIAECLHLFERLDADTVPRPVWERPR